MYIHTYMYMVNCICTYTRTHLYTDMQAQVFNSSQYRFAIMIIKLHL